MKTFSIGKFKVNDPLNPYIIAEIGVNHGGDMVKAKELISQAAQSGAHAAKFQSYKAGKIASKNSPAYWDRNEEPTDSQYKLFQKYDSFNPEDYRELARYCESLGIDFMSTPFDLDAVDFLSPIMPAIKIASADITNIPLIRKCAKVGKPLILSTGAATLPEIEYALQEAKSHGAKEIAILHCVLNYPTPEENAQLNLIEELQRVFPSVAVGYSDHVVPDRTISALEVAVLKGAVILEKHFTHDKKLPGNDHYHAMDQVDLAEFVKKLEMYRKLLSGSQAKNIEKEEMARLQARRSIVAARDILKGEVIKETDLIAKRPAHGISPIHWDLIIGKTAIDNIKDDTAIQWGMFE